jgi:hypothetical protein
MADLLDIPIGGSDPGPVPQPARTPVVTPTPAAPTPIQPEIKEPTVEEMEAELQQSGVLLNELPVIDNKYKIDNSPLAALQPDNMLKSPGGPQPMNLPSESQPVLKDTELATTHVTTPVSDSLRNSLLGPIKHLVTLALSAHAILGIYHSAYFVIVEYPHLELQLIQHMITAEEVNILAIKAVIKLIMTVLNIFLAFKIFHSSKLHHMHTVLGIILFVSSTYLNTFLSTKYDLITLISRPVFQVIEQQMKQRSNEPEPSEVPVLEVYR